MDPVNPPPADRPEAENQAPPPPPPENPGTEPVPPPLPKTAVLEPETDTPTPLRPAPEPAPEPEPALPPPPLPPRPQAVPPPVPPPGYVPQWQAAAPPPKRGRGCFFYFLLCFFLIVVGGGLLLVGVPAFALMRASKQAASEFADVGVGDMERNLRETFVPGAGGNTCSQKVAVISVQGMILPDGGRGFAGSNRIVAELNQACEDDDVVAVILDMNTPGGDVTSSDEIYRAVRRCHGHKPVVTCMRSMGASGGYYVAAGSDWIIANQHTLTGSIGVIMNSLNYAELMDRWGLKMVTIKSGQMKDMLSGSRPASEAEREYMQKLVDETFHEFVAIVADGRSAFADVDAVLAADFADGRVLRGPDALAAGLVDQLGYFADAVNKAQELAGTYDVKLVSYRRRSSLSEFLLDLSANRDLTQAVLPAELRAMKPGGLYAIWPGALTGDAE